MKGRNELDVFAVGAGLMTALWLFVGGLVGMILLMRRKKACLAWPDVELAGTHTPALNSISVSTIPAHRPFMK